MVMSIDEIEIIYKYFKSTNTTEPVCYLNGDNYAIGYSDTNWKILSANDGFDSVEQFFQWFDKDFKGKLIHWTDYEYETLPF